MNTYTTEAAELHRRGMAAKREGRSAEAEDLFRQAYEAGHPEGAYELGHLAAGRGDEERAEEWWRIAAEMGLPAGAFEVGWIEERRDDLDAAERWYRRAAEGGHKDGVLNLGVLVKDRGDLAEAENLYRRAWELGSDRAAFNLGLLYDDGGRGDQDAAETWYSRAAERGNGGAAFNLGFVRMDRGDTEGAYASWRHAADLGHPKAAHCLAEHLLKAGDEDGALPWFHRSLRKFGHTGSADRLSEIYRGRGDARRADFWYHFPRGMRDYSPEFETFAAAGSAAAIHRQDVLNEALGDDHTYVDIPGRTLTVGDRTYRGLTFLGSFSHLSRTWLWGWANPHQEPDSPALAALRTIRDHGERHGIPELTTGELDLSGFPDPHQAATTMVIAAAALLGGNGVRSVGINGGKGSAYLHLDDPALPPAEFDRLAVPRLLDTAVQIFRADHRAVVRGFLTHYDFEIEESPDAINGRSQDGVDITVGFTDDGLIKAMSVGKRS